MTTEATPRRCTSSTSRLHRPLAAHAEKRTKDQLGLEERTASRKGDRSALRRRRVHVTTVGDSPDRGRAGRQLVLQVGHVRGVISAHASPNLRWCLTRRWSRTFGSLYAPPEERLYLLDAGAYIIYALS